MWIGIVHAIQLLAVWKIQTPHNIHKPKSNQAGWFDQTRPIVCALIMTETGEH